MKSLALFGSCLISLLSTHFVLQAAAHPHPNDTDHSSDSDSDEFFDDWDIEPEYVVILGMGVFFVAMAIVAIAILCCYTSKKDDMKVPDNRF